MQRYNFAGVFLYGCETWSLTFREKHMLNLFENRVLRTAFGSKRDEVTGHWKRLHNEELHDLYCSKYVMRVTKSRRTKWAGHVARMGKGEVHAGWGNLRETNRLEDIRGWVQKFPA